MNRCQHRAKSLFLIANFVLLTGAIGLFSSESSAQVVRGFPKAALRGTLVVTNPPDVLLDGRPDRLSPGSRIRSPQNMLVMSGALQGQRLTVNYTRDAAGLLHEVWILNPEEAREKRAGQPVARNFLFESEARPLRDDGKTPFNQLPVYPRQ